MNRPYIVQLSNKTEVQIDADELPLVTEGINTASPILLRRGIINPSFIVCIIEDKERWENLMQAIPGVTGSDTWVKERERRRAQGPTPLRDIFKNSPLGLEKPNIDKLE